MSLPQLQTPTYTTTIPSTGDTIKFRPFLVREEKIMMIAMQEESLDPVLEAIKQIIENCTLNSVDVGKLTSYDLEWIFLQIRIKSKGSFVDLQFKCKKEDCGQIITKRLDLEKDVYISGDPKRKEEKIILDEDQNIGIVMKQATYETTQKLIHNLSSEDKDMLGVIIFDNVEEVFHGDTIYDDFSREEFSDWIDQLNIDQFNKIREFLNSMTTLEAKIEAECKCHGTKDTIIMKGLNSFLG